MTKFTGEEIRPARIRQQDPLGQGGFETLGLDFDQAAKFLRGCLAGKMQTLSIYVKMLLT